MAPRCPPTLSVCLGLVAFDWDSWEATLPTFPVRGIILDYYLPFRYSAGSPVTNTPKSAVSKLVAVCGTHTIPGARLLLQSLSSPPYPLVLPRS